MIRKILLKTPTISLIIAMMVLILISTGFLLNKSNNVWNKIEIVFLRSKVLFTNHDRLINEFDKLNTKDLLRDENSASLKYWLIAIGPETFMNKFISEAKSYKNDECHLMAHKLGGLAYQLFRGEALTINDYSCGSGFLHGAVAESLEEIGNNPDKHKTLTDLCEGFKEDYKRTSCYHGIGHGIMGFNDNDLLKSIKDCKELSDIDTGNHCLGGVFMENQFASSSNIHKTKWLSDDPYFPCNELTDQSFVVQQRCYDYQAARMLFLTNYDYTRVSDLCNGAPVLFKGGCFGNLGQQVAGEWSSDMEKISNLCKLVPEFEEQCNEGVMTFYHYFLHKNIKNQAVDYCNLASVERKPSCYKSIGKYLHQIFSEEEDKVKTICSLADDSQDHQSCLSGARMN